MEVKSSLYKKLNSETIQCFACSRSCSIENNEYGFCNVRKNSNGKLDLRVYGKPCATWVDPIEKKPLFHFLPGTNSYSIGTFGCNFRCTFCQNSDIAQEIPEQRKRMEQLIKNTPELSSEEAVLRAIRAGCKSISYTYNEPTIFSEYAQDIGVFAREKGLKNIYVTNGYQTKKCWDYLSKFVDAVNIDLKGDEKFYKEICGDVKAEVVKESIEYAHKKGIWIEVTTLVIPGENDDEKFLRESAEFLYSIDNKMPWHITAFYPHFKMKNKKPTDPEVLEKARKIGEEVGLKHIYIGNIYSEYQNTICPKCKEIIVKRQGFEINENKIEKGKCSFCKNKINGVFE